MDLKLLFQKIENIIYPKLQNNTFKYTFNKEELDEIFTIIYPYLIIYSKTYNIKDDDLSNDFAIYFYEKFDYIINHYDINKSSISTYLILAIKTKFLEFLRLNKIENKEISYNENLKYKNINQDYSENDNSYYIYENNYITNDYELSENNRYKNIIYNIINSLETIDKAIFCLYYYEIIDDNIIIELSNILNISISELIKIINEFRDKNNKKYETFEVIKAKLYTQKEIKDDLYKKVLTYNITGDISIISKLLNLSENAIRIKLTRIKDKIEKNYDLYNKNF